MTYAYDLERLRVAIADIIKAAGVLVTHGEALPIPVLDRLARAVGECHAVDKLLESHQKEIQE
jgi:hypothetical protein